MERRARDITWEADGDETNRPPANPPSEAIDAPAGDEETLSPDQRDPTNASPYIAGQGSTTGLGGVGSETAGGGSGADLGGGTVPPQITERIPGASNAAPASGVPGGGMHTRGADANSLGGTGSGPAGADAGGTPSGDVGGGASGRG